MAKGKKEVVILFDDMARPTPVSEIVPYVLRWFGKCGEGRLQLPQPLPTKVKRFIVLSPFKNHVGGCFFRKVSSILWAKTWEEVLDLLIAEWGNKANVAIYSDGTIQYFSSFQV